MAQKETSSKSRRWLGLSGAAVLVANLVLTGTTIAFQQEGEVNHALGIEGAGASYGGTEFSADGTLSDASYEKYIEAAYQFCEQEEEEGSVLLYNRNNALPLSESERNVTVFGRGSIDPVFRSTAGGSSTNPDYQKTPVDALQDAGFNVNQTVLDAYASADAPKERSVSSVGEYDPALFTGSVTDSFASYGDVAFVTLSRFATEGNDLAMVNDKGKRMLELDDNEKAIFQQIKDSGKFKKTVVLLNSVFAMEMDWLDEYNVDAVLWVGNPGFYGMPGAIRVVTGEVNPSGHTTATFAANSLSAPSAENFGLHAYNYGSKTPRAAGDSFVSYNEGIYVGYKFYETAADEGLIDYDKEVVYPFGYGLSYTTFTQKMSDITSDGSSLKFSVTVTNTGSAAGKDVVEIYNDPPYTNGGIEKASANLLDFAKTSELAPGESETIDFTIPVEDLASYDYKNNGCYVLEAGDYIISTNSDSHNVLDSKTYTVASDIVYNESNKRESDAVAATNQFDFAEGEITYLSRADGFANYDEATAAPADYNMSDEVKAVFDNAHTYTEVNYEKDDDPNAEDITTGAKNGLKLADLRGVDYNDSKWDDLLDEMSIDDLQQTIGFGGYQTAAVDSIGKVRTNDCDGPASINNNFTGVGSVGFPAATLIGMTWSKELAYSFGDSIGEMANEMDTSGWYGPAMNIHRTAFAGRNFEYYSEDGVLSGAMAANAIAGAQEHGVYAYMKHFALNDQEGNRTSMLATWSNEQAIREIYLKPFEMSVKDADCHAVMSSFNYIGSRWAGGCKELLQNVLRGEWGFKGHITTDGFAKTSTYKTHYMEMITAGVDFVCLDPGETAAAVTAAIDGGDGYIMQQLRRATKANVYAASRSISANGLSSNSIVVNIVPWWEMVLLVVTAICGITFIGCTAACVVMTYGKKNKKVEG